MEKVYLSLGSNVNDRLIFLQKAVREIENDTEIEILKLSSVYETEPVGFTEQNYFYNLILEIQTKYDPTQLLCVCKTIEKKLGRIPRGRWMAREIDIDIIFFGSQIINSKDLIVPHKELYNRKFVLEPLNEIAPMFRCPLKDESVKELLNICGDNSKIKKIFKFIPGVT
jgi:2-amino-4-hydroxy-6-hydroxymethyldihydropteridine diphosphokinase